jgi:hypothetical protein
LCAGFGTQAASLRAAGYLPATAAATATTELWNGTSWSEVNDVNTARLYVSGCGSSTAGLLASGYTGTALPADVESWNGTSWTEVANVNTARFFTGTAGTQTLAITFGGRPPAPGRALTESWNGSAWTEVGDLATARADLPGAGTAAAALAISGATAPATQTAVTEEWTAPQSITFTVS